MPDTVWVALITFASGLVGTVVGAVVSYKTSMMGMQSDKGKLLHDEKREAYSELLAAHDDIMSYFIRVKLGRYKLGEGNLGDVTYRFSRAHSKAMLIAPASVRGVIREAAQEIYNVLDGEEYNEASDVPRKLITVMREDLMAFSAGAEECESMR